MEKNKNEIGCLAFILFFMGSLLLFLGLAALTWDGISSFISIPLGSFLIYIAYKQNLKFKEASKQESAQIEEKKLAEEREKRTIDEKRKIIKQNRLKNVDSLNIKLSEIKKIKITDVSDLKNIIIDNEKTILEKGGDNQLFSFMKINTFLNDYRGRIISDQSGLKKVLDIKWLKSRIESEEKRNDLDKITENLEDTLARMEGRKTTGFDSSVNSLFELGDLMKPSLENQIKTMEFYRNMAVVMIVFYLDDKKIRYFELYEAFEKLGVFDSTWQKNVLNKLDNIEIRLTQMSNQLTELNQNFISLSESSENIVLELKEINSSVMTNNMLQAITAYQTWRINKNTKSLRP